MGNERNKDISGKSFDIPKDNVVDLKVRTGINEDEKENEFSNMRTQSARKFGSKANPINRLKNTAKNGLHVFSSQSSVESQQSDKEDNDEINNERKTIKSNYFLRYFLYFLVFFLPLFFLPFSVEIFEFNKIFLLFTVSSLAFLVWIAKMIVVDRCLIFVKTPLDIPIFIFIFIVLLSTILSVDKISSVLGFYGRSSDSLMVYSSLVMLYFVGVNSAVERSTVFINSLVKVFLASSFVVIIVSLFYFLGIKLIPLDEAQFDSFNLVGGSLNILGIYLVSVVIIAFYYLLEVKNVFVKYLVYLFVVLSLILLAVIDFIPAWIVLAISLLVSLVSIFMTQKQHSRVYADGKSMRQCLIPTGLIVIISLAFAVTSLTFINKNVESNFKSSIISSSIKDRVMPSVDNGQIGAGNGFAKEIILDKKTAVSIAIEGIKKDPISGIVGTGPGTYLYNFSKFKPVEFNSSIFWSVRFDKAGSEIIEKVSTIGVLGVISYLLIMILAVGMFLRTSKQIRNNNFVYLFSAWLSLLLFQFLYFESTTIKFVFWMLTIVLAVEYYSSRTQDARENILWEFKIKKTNHIFYLSLLLVMTVSFAAFYYYQIRFYQAEVTYKNTIFAYNKAVKDINLSRQGVWDILDKSVEDLNGVIEKNPYNGTYKLYLSDIYFNRLAIVIQEESEKSEEEKNNQIIAREMKGVVDHAKDAADASPNNIVFQQKLGNIYAYMFNNIKIMDADEWAIKKYDRAISLEPTSPILYTELGKIYISQYLESADEGKMNDAISEFEKALELKSDYLDTGFQLGLAYEIKGDNKKAISQLSSFIENGTADVNIAFQLGRIHYNSGNINEAKEIFLEIIRVQPRNSNARYSLGLIYEKEENNEEALREFEAVLLLNPDNREVVGKIEELKKNIEKENKKPEPIPVPEPTPEPVIDEEGVEDRTEVENIE